MPWMITMQNGLQEKWKDGKDRNQAFGDGDQYIVFIRFK